MGLGWVKHVDQRSVLSDCLYGVLVVIALCVWDGVGGWLVCVCVWCGGWLVWVVWWVASVCVCGGVVVCAWVKVWE